MSYVEEQCTPLAEVKEQIKKGLFGDLTELSDIKLYRNAKRQWRLKFVAENDTKTKKRNVNVLAAVLGESIYVNKKSLDFSVGAGSEEEDVSKLAEKILL